MATPHSTLFGITSMIQRYASAQNKVTSMAKSLASKMSSISPGNFLLLQMYMGKVTQVGESISNVLAQLNSIISNAIKNQRVQ